MKTYTLKGKDGHPDISFTVEDLVPVPTSKVYRPSELHALYNYSRYQPPCEVLKDCDYAYLFEHCKQSHTCFFKINGTGIIIIPDDFIQPTILSEQEII
jgi:hypothetical protein